VLSASRRRRCTVSGSLLELLLQFGNLPLALLVWNVRGAANSTAEELGVDERGTSGKLVVESVGGVVMAFNAGSGGDEVAGVVGKVEGSPRLESRFKVCPVV
jgi:hypothetical protein